MQKIFHALFSSVERTVVTLVVIGTLLVNVYPSASSRFRVGLNEDFAAEPTVQLDANTLNAKLAGQCHGGKTPRIFLSWPAIEGTVQKQASGGAWTTLVNSNRKTFYADRDVELGTSYSYRIKKSAKVFSNTVTIRPSIETCTSTPIATIVSSTPPGHASPFYIGETLQLSVMGEPNKTVKSCFTFNNDSGCDIGTYKTDASGIWTTDLQSLGISVGNWRRWAVIDGVKSNILQYEVIAPPGIPTGLTAKSGSSTCSNIITPITLSWNAVQGITSYNVRRADNVGGLYNIIASGLTTPSYADTNARGTYYYVVTSVDQYGAESHFSNEAKADFFVQDCPTPTPTSQFPLSIKLNQIPGVQTATKGSANVTALALAITNSSASDVLIHSIALTGYYSTDGKAYFPGSSGQRSVADLVSSVRLVNMETGAVVLSVENNLASKKGSVVFNDDYFIPRGRTVGLLVSVDLTNNWISQAGDYFSFDINEVETSTGIRLNDPMAHPNGGQNPLSATRIVNGGSISASLASESPGRGAMYWGQLGRLTSIFRFTATQEGQFIEKMTIGPTNDAESSFAGANVKTVTVSFKNKAGDAVAGIAVPNSKGIVNFGWSGGANDTRPYIPKDSTLDVSVKVDMKTKAEGATESMTTPVYFSSDLLNTYKGSVADGFRAIGEASGQVTDGSAITGVAGSNVYVYRVFPQLAYFGLTPGKLAPGADLLKVTLTAMGLPDSKMLFDNTSASKGSILFVLKTNAPAGSTIPLSVYDENGTLLDSGNTTSVANGTAQYLFDFSNQNMEISGGTARTIRVVLDGSASGATYMQATIPDNDGQVHWVSDSSSGTGSIAGTLRFLPIAGPAVMAMIQSPRNYGLANILLETLRILFK